VNPTPDDVAAATAALRRFRRQYAVALVVGGGVCTVIVGLGVDSSTPALWSVVGLSGLAGVAWGWPAARRRTLRAHQATLDAARR